MNYVKKKFVWIGFIVLLLSFFVIFFIKPSFTPSSRIDLSRDSVIKEIQSLGNLETASYSIEKIVEAGTDGNPIQNLLFGDKILLIAHGKVIAGIDMTVITKDNIQVDGKELKAMLPAPTILSSALDNQKTKVYDRTQGYLNRGNTDLESETRRAAEESITRAACEAGILEDARINAIERIKQLFLFAGFTHVEVIIPAGNCSKESI